VYFTAGDAKLERLLGFFRQHVSIHACVEATGFSSPENLVSLLDAGARTIFAQSSQLVGLESYNDRLALIVSDDEDKPARIPGGGVLIKCGNNIETTRAALKKYTDSKVSPVYLYCSSKDNLESYTQLARESGVVAVIPATRLTMENQKVEDQLSVPAIISAAWTTDRSDKLMPTVVTDERGISLGLVYSSQESLSESLMKGQGVYQSRKRGLWYKGATSGDTQELVAIRLDCDQDCMQFIVKQQGRGFCHLPQSTCFGQYSGIAKLEKTLQSRKASAPEGSYTARLFNDEKLLRAKIMEEAEELCDAKTAEEVAFEAADLIYFAMTKAISAGVSLADIEHNLDAKSLKVKRRPGNAKGQWAAKEGITNGETPKAEEKKETVKEAEGRPKSKEDAAGTSNGRITMRRLNAASLPASAIQEALQRPSQKSTDVIMGIVNPIIKEVRTRGDAALLEYTHKFEKATSLTSPVLKAPFPESLMQLPEETIEAIDVSFENIRKFHTAQKDEKVLQVETMPGVTCSRFSRPIERVGLYVPGGSAVLPSTALMLGVPAMVAGCKKIVLASPPRADGTLTPEVVYIAHKVGAESIVLAGGAQAVAAMAYGTESVTKVDKILGPGNQFVTAAKMYVSNDTNAGVSIDMPAGPSEVLVIADKDANPAFVASDLLSQAEHGPDSQVVLIAIDLSEEQLQAIEDELHDQAMALPRVDIVRGAIAHSVTLVVKDLEEAMRLSNDYAPEHLILQIKDAAKAVDLVQNAGSVFIGEWTPESVGDYSAGVNHSLRKSSLCHITKFNMLTTLTATYGYAKQYSGVNLASYLKHITSSNLTATGLRNVGKAVMQLAKVEELEAHRRAVEIRLQYMEEKKL
jgi:phosphoribosyl-ATP pyrophosphohydrolase/phosphoribosyl-AMP cyclohydrolase/histidinol dehydrogenase